MDPGIATLPNTADSSSFKYKINLINLFENCEFINQYNCGIINRLRLADNQFNANLMEKTLTFGSKDENKFVIKSKRALRRLQKFLQYYE